MPADTKGSEGSASSRKEKAAAAAAPAALSGVAKLIAAESEAAIAAQAWDAAASLHALDARVQEVLVALPGALASVDDASEIGGALRALSALLG